MKDLRGSIQHLHECVEKERDRLAAAGIDWQTKAKKFKSKIEAPKFAVQKNFHHKNASHTRLVGWGKGFQLVKATSGVKAVGGILVQNAKTGAVEHLFQISPRDSMKHLFSHISLEQTSGSILAASNLHGFVQLFSLPPYKGAITPMKQISKIATSGAASPVCFMSDDTIMVADGSVLKKYNVKDTISPNASYNGHTMEIFSLARKPQDKNIILTGGADFTTRMWDVRDKTQTNSYDTGSRDTNSLEFFPDGKSFAAGLNNSEVHLYDTRMTSRLMTFRSNVTYRKHSTEQVAFSRSGRILFAGYSRQTVLAYDVAKPTDFESKVALNQSVIHDFRSKDNITCESFAMQREGKCLALSDNSKSFEVKLVWPSH